MCICLIWLTCLLLAYLLGEDLYKELQSFLDKRLEDQAATSRTHSDETLLQFYIKEWERYTNSAKYVNHMFRYLNRHWVKREMEEGKKNIYDVYTLHLVQWRRALFEPVSGRVMAAVLQLVERQRLGETIEHNQIKQVVDSFVSLGLDESDPSRTTLEVYRFYFEKPFLEATRTFYAAESKQFLAENSVVEYMKKAEIRLKEEEDRVSMYLHPDIAIHLKKECNQVLIADHAALLKDEFQSLLDTNREEDMGRMYLLLARIPDGLEPLRAKFENHVRRAGLSAVQNVMGTDADRLEPKVYVDALLEVHTQYQGLVKRAFANEPEFTRALDNACREFVNRNDVCKAGGANKSPELVARYTDVLLRKGTVAIEEDQLEIALTQIMTVFKYIEDKDVFQKFYSRMLARRLVHSNSASDDAETSMISKLKKTCGFEYTNKLQRMFQDIALSKEMNRSYGRFIEDLNESNKNSGGDAVAPSSRVDSSFAILGTSFWPLTPPVTTFMPPPIIQRDCDQFITWYRKQHDGRKLTWLWNLCKGDIRTNYNKGNTRHILQVSAYQMGVLMLFNDADTHSYTDIANATTLMPEVLDQALNTILKARVLLMKPEGGRPGPEKTFSLNLDFKNRKMRIKLDVGGVKETKQEEAETNKTIEEDRKLLLQVSVAVSVVCVCVCVRERE